MIDKDKPLFYYTKEENRIKFFYKSVIEVLEAELAIINEMSEQMNNMSEEEWKEFNKELEKKKRGLNGNIIIGQKGI